MDNSKRLILKNGGTSQIIDPDDILYILSGGAYCTVYELGGRKLTVSKSLNVLNGSLEVYGFFCRIHHSHLVNINYVVSYNGSKDSTVTMSDGKTLPIARGRKRAFLDCFHQL